MNVIVLDTITGQKIESEQTHFKDYDIWWWTEGNGGCDCNRAMMFTDDIDDAMEAQMREANPELKEHQSYCYGEKRFLVVAVDPMPKSYTLLDFNDGYSDSILTKFGII